MSFFQKDSLKGGPFWQKGSFITHILSELWLLWYLAQSTLILKQKLSFCSNWNEVSNTILDKTTTWWTNVSISVFLEFIVTYVLMIFPLIFQVSKNVISESQLFYKVWNLCFFTNSWSSFKWNFVFKVGQWTTLKSLISVEF